MVIKDIQNMIQGASRHSKWKTGKGSGTAGVLLGVHLGVLVLFGLSEALMGTWSRCPRAGVEGRSGVLSHPITSKFKRAMRHHLFLGRKRAAAASKFQNRFPVINHYSRFDLVLGLSHAQK